MFRVGITGTRRGATPEQRKSLARFLLDFPPDEFHHGDCVGADAQAHLIALSILDCKIVIHPPIKDTYRAFCHKVLSGRITVEPEAEYITRDHAIVRRTAMLIAIPKGDEEEQRSGTWATVRYARTLKRPVGVIWPSGRLEFYAP